MSIVVIGATFVDIKGYPSSIYIPGGRNAGTVEQIHGGVARNIAEDVANIGFPCTFVTLLDESGISADVEQRLRQRGVDTHYIRRTPDGLGTWLAIFDNDGDVTAAISRRPDLTPVADILRERGEEIFAEADSVLMELDADLETLELIFALAKKHAVPVYCVVTNMSIAVERREYLLKTDCFVCNLQEAEILFVEHYQGKSPEELREILQDKVQSARIPGMVVTMGGDGAVYACINGESGVCPAMKVDVVDTTGAGDAFFAGVSAALTSGKTLSEACVIGTRLSAAVIGTTENVCPRFQPEEFGLKSE